MTQQAGENQAMNEIRLVHVYAQPDKDGASHYAAVDLPPLRVGQYIAILPVSFDPAKEELVRVARRQDETSLMLSGKCDLSMISVRALNSLEGDGLQTIEEMHRRVVSIGAGAFKNIKGLGRKGQEEAWALYRANRHIVDPVSPKF